MNTGAEENEPTTTADLTAHQWQARLEEQQRIIDEKRGEQREQRVTAAFRWACGRKLQAQTALAELHPSASDAPVRVPGCAFTQCRVAPAASAPAPLSSCARCLCVSYCSKACQKSDWRRHKPTCTPHATAVTHSEATAAAATAAPQEDAVPAPPLVGVETNPGPTVLAVGMAYVTAAVAAPAQLHAAPGTSSAPWRDRQRCERLLQLHPTYDIITLCHSRDGDADDDGNGNGGCVPGHHLSAHVGRRAVARLATLLTAGGLNPAGRNGVVNIILMDYFRMLPEYVRGLHRSLMCDMIPAMLRQGQFVVGQSQLFLPNWPLLWNEVKGRLVNLPCPPAGAALGSLPTSRCSVHTAPLLAQHNPLHQASQPFMDVNNVQVDTDPQHYGPAALLTMDRHAPFLLVTFQFLPPKQAGSRQARAKVPAAAAKPPPRPAAKATAKASALSSRKASVSSKRDSRRRARAEELDAFMDREAETTRRRAVQLTPTSPAPTSVAGLLAHAGGCKLQAQAALAASTHRAATCHRNLCDAFLSIPQHSSFNVPPAPRLVGIEPNPGPGAPETAAADCSSPSSAACASGSKRDREPGNPLDAIGLRWSSRLVSKKAKGDVPPSSSSSLHEWAPLIPPELNGCLISTAIVVRQHVLTQSCGRGVGDARMTRQVSCSLVLDCVFPL